MAEKRRMAELVLVELEDAGERRTVSLVEGGSMALVECTSGPLTMAAYGSAYHGHKMLFGSEACATALGVTADEVKDTLVALYADAQQAPYLSDIMDRFDTSGQTYRYVAWSGTGDIVFRSEAVA